MSASPTAVHWWVMTTLRQKNATRSQIQRAQNLHRREARRKYGQFLVEGPQAVREILECAPELIRDLYVEDGAFERYPEIKALVQAENVWTHFAVPADFRDLSSNAQGFAIVADMPEEPSLESVLAGAKLVIATIATADPGNLGTIIRSADAAGANAVVIGQGSAELYSPKVVRSTVGSLFHIPCVSGADFAELAEAAHAAGLQVLAADAHGEWELSTLMDAAAERRLLGTRVDGPDLTRPTMWVVGNEAHGFDGVDISAADAVVSIPIFGRAESLNVSIAGALVSYLSALTQRQG